MINAPRHPQFLDIVLTSQRHLISMRRRAVRVCQLPAATAAFVFESGSTVTDLQQDLEFENRQHRAHELRVSVEDLEKDLGKGKDDEDAFPEEIVTINSVVRVNRSFAHRVVLIITVWHNVCYACVLDRSLTHIDSHKTLCI
jgi:hypothetical protein